MKTLIRVALAVTLVLIAVTPAFAQDPGPGGDNSGSRGGGRGGEIVNALRKVAEWAIDVMIGVMTIVGAVAIGPKVPTARKGIDRGEGLRGKGRGGRYRAACPLLCP